MELRLDRYNVHGGTRKTKLLWAELDVEFEWGKLLAFVVRRVESLHEHEFAVGSLCMLQEAKQREKSVDFGAGAENTSGTILRKRS